jgi:hypothetical protein
MRGYANFSLVEHIQQICPLKKCKNPTIKNHFGHTWYGFKTYKPFPLVIFASFIVIRYCVF